MAFPFCLGLMAAVSSIVFLEIAEDISRTGQPEAATGDLQIAGDDLSRVNSAT
jgi:hypothetical protein